MASSTEQRSVFIMDSINQQVGEVYIKRQTRDGGKEGQTNDLASHLYKRWRHLLNGFAPFSPFGRFPFSISVDADTRKRSH